MSEKDVIVDEVRITYSGIFKLKDLIGYLKHWTEDYGYDFFEKNHTESVMSKGKFVEFDILLERKFADYAKGRIEIKAQLSDIQDKILEKEGVKKKFDVGEVVFVLSSALITDWEKRWILRPTFYVIREFFERYVYSSFLSMIKKEVKENTFSLRNNIKSFLNLYKY